VVDVLFGQAHTRYSTGSWRAGGCCLDAPSACTSSAGAHGGQHLAWTSSPPTAVPPYRTYRTAMYLTCGNAGRAGWAVCPQGGPRCCPPHYCPAGISGKPSFTPSAGPGLVDGARPKETGPPEHPITRELLGLPENLLEPCDGRAGRAGRAPPAGLRMLGSWVLGSGLGAMGSGRAACEVYIGT
jgi:hypothetical protein